MKERCDMNEAFPIVSVCILCPPTEVDERYTELRICAFHREMEGGSDDVLVSFSKDFVMAGPDTTGETGRAWSTWQRKDRERKARRKKRL